MERKDERSIWTVVLMIVLAIAVLSAESGCSTTPNTDAQWESHYARLDAREAKASCLSNNGVWIEDRSVGRSGAQCISRATYDEALSRARMRQQ